MKKNPFYQLKIVDYFILIISLSIISFLAFNLYQRSGQASRVLIRSERGDAVYDLNTDQILEIEGALGILLLQIQDRTVRILEAPCDDQLCIYMGTLSRSGDWSACLPSRVVVEIIGQKEDDLDGFSY